jgi:2,3-bisphosphoglycerate-dependent phosphoglycerate mutase
VIQQVLLIRHGESQANAGERTPNHVQTALTPLGKLQAQALGYHWREFFPDPNLIVTSPFLRAQETAQPLIERFPGVPVETWAVQEFVRLDSPKLGNTTFEERQPLVRAWWERGDPDWREPNAESLHDFFGRLNAMFALLEEQMDKGTETVAVFTHGHFMRAALWKMMGHPTEKLSHKGMQEFHDFCDRLAVPNTMIAGLFPTGLKLVGQKWTMHWDYGEMRWAWPA